MLRLTNKVVIGAAITAATVGSTATKENNPKGRRPMRFYAALAWKCFYNSQIRPLETARKIAAESDGFAHAYDLALLALGFGIYLVLPGNNLAAPFAWLSAIVPEWVQSLAFLLVGWSMLVGVGRAEAARVAKCALALMFLCFYFLLATVYISWAALSVVVFADALRRCWVAYAKLAPRRKKQPLTNGAQPLSSP